MKSEDMESEDRLVELVGAPIMRHTALIDGHEINYVSAGDGSGFSQGPPLILVHGANIGWGQWYKNIGELAKNFKVYALDLPGCGHSSKIDFFKLNFKEHFTDVLKKFIWHIAGRRVAPERAANGGHKVYLAGHSIGALVAMNVVIDEPDLIQKLVLVNPMGLTNHLPFEQFPLAFKPLVNLLSKTAMKPNKENIKKFLMGAQNQNAQNRGEEPADEFVDYVHDGINRIQVTHPFHLIHQFVEPFRIKEEYIMKEKLGEIKTPTLIATGAQDSMVPLQDVFEAQAKFPNSAMHVFYDSGHVPFMEESENFNRVLINFLA